MKRIALTALLLIATCPVFAQSDFSGPGRFPQYRSLSGLSGGGFGLDVRGYRSLDGPTAFSTPIGPVLGHGQVQLLQSAMSVSSFPTFDRDRLNGSAAIMYGQSVGSFNIAGTIFIKSLDGDQVYNVQLGYVPSRDSRWAISLGVQDFEGRGGAAGESSPGDQAMSRSLFAVATYRFQAGKRPIYLSLGSGRRRFGKVFGSVSAPLSPGVRLWAEQDGFGWNFGTLFTMRPFGRNNRTELNASVGFIQAKRFTVAFGVGF